MEKGAARIQIVKDLETAGQLWALFTPDKTIYDNWEFRNCFYKYCHYELFFYTAYIDERPTALLPLQFNTEKNYLEFFGGDYMEDNRCFAQPGHEELISKLYQAVDKPAHLQFITGQDSFTTNLPVKDFKYTLSADKLKDYWGYLQNTGHAETRKTLQKQIRRIEREGIEIVRNQFADLELLFKLNIDVFGERSSFNRPGRKEVFRDLLKLPWPIFLLSFKVAGITQGVSLAILYKDVLECFNTGANRQAVPDLNKFICYTSIKTAAENDTKLLDFFTGNYGYKELWFFDKTPEYIFDNITLKLS